MFVLRCETCGGENITSLQQQPRKDTPTMTIPFTMTQDSIIVLLDGKPHTVRANTPQYNGIKQAILTERWGDIGQLVTLPGALQQWLGDKFVVNGRTISYEGVPLDGALSERILTIAHAGESPAPLFAFYERLHKNPSFRSRVQLFNFLRHCGIPIEPDGTFLAYKGVKHDYTDGHTGRVDNNPGAHNVMARNLISDDPDVACHYGYHVGALSYARTFSDRVVICRVDPEHVVCVPSDYGHSKMRVCDYTVVGNWAGTTDGDVMPSTTFTPDVAREEEEDEDWSGDVEGEDQDEYDAIPEVDYDSLDPALDAVPATLAERTHQKKRLVVAKKPAGPKAAKFARMTPATLMEQSIDDLRKYASAHLKIVGASKMSGGKSALVSKILKIRRRRRR
jgi:hypothetical protein